MGKQMSKFLVTGGLGLIGHNVVARLEKDHEVSIIDNRTTYGIIPQSEVDYLMSERLQKIQTRKIYSASIESAETVDYVIEQNAVDVIVHMASFPRQKVVNANPAAGADVMMRGLINMLESAKKHRVQRFVYISSSMVYGDFEDQVLEDDECNPQGQYGIMKLAGEWLVKDYARRCGFEYVIIRPSAVYGPLDVEDRVVAKFMIAAMQNQTLKVNGANETLDFTYVDDAADGIVAAATRIMARNNTYNITKSHSVSLLEAAEMIVAIAGAGQIEVADRDLDFPSRGALNIDRARTILGYNPQVDVREGFENYFTWIKRSIYWSSKAVRPTAS
jgi:nucleoside-diphosphate-sugar epimerase